MLSGNQRDQVANLIFLYLGFSPSPATIQALVGPEPARTAPAGANGYQLALWLLNYTLAAPRPDLFIDVISAVDAQGELLEVRQLVDHLRQDASVWTTQAGDELWIPPRWPFADRQELRQRLLAMANGNGPAAITIEAPRGHGKRTMCAYIDYLAQRHGGFQPVVAHLRQEPSPGVLDALVADLRIGLGLDLDDDTTHIEPERRAVVAARALAQRALYVPSGAWLVANVIETTGLEAGVLRFIDELLAQVQAIPGDQCRLRVVLLADEVAGLGLANLPARTARYVLPEVDKDAVSGWLAAAAPGKAPEIYELTTTMVLSRVEQMGLPPAERLGWLARQCTAAHRLLVRTG
jgi:hypothetical protein